MRSMIKIVEVLNNNQQALYDCAEKIDGVYELCTKRDNNAYQLLELYGLTKRISAYSYYVMLNLADTIKAYANRIDALDFIINMTTNNGPQSFVTESEIIRLNNDPDFLYKLLTVMDEKLIDFENYEQVVNDEMVHTSSKKISSISKEIFTNIAYKISEMENANISDDEDDDFLKNIANEAILKALKSHNVNEVALLPDDVRIEIIKILQIGLNIYDINDIYQLFYLADQRLIQLFEETKKIDALNLARKK